MLIKPDVVCSCPKINEQLIKNTFDTFNRVDYQSKLNSDVLQFPEEF